MIAHILLIATAVVIWNVITFALYGIDKAKAKKGKWRISEATLIICAFMMGGLGSFVGMRVFRHKTQHIKFVILVPLAMVVNIVIVFLLFYLGLI